MTTPIWYQKAVSELGQREITGKLNNARIVEYQKATGLAASDDETPWCGSFVAWCMMQSGIPYDKKNAAWAKSWLTFGKSLKTPITGAIAVMQRGTDVNTGHVTFFSEWANAEHTLFKALGGNQSNSVCIESLPVANVLGWRWPNEVKLPVSEQPLKKSGVIHGAVVSGAGAIALGGEAVNAIASNPDAIVGGVTRAHDAYNANGAIFGLIAAVVILLGVGYVIYSRIKGKQDDKAIGQVVEK